MPQYFQLAQRGVSSISIDGVEHKADPETGVLTVEMLTPNLNQNLRERGAVAVSGPGGQGPGGHGPGGPQTGGVAGAPQTGTGRQEAPPAGERQEKPHQDPPRPAGKGKDS
jgi:hypothetical protein